MNKYYKVVCLILLGFIIILSGCGGLEGAPGSDSDKTGILIQSVRVTGGGAGGEIDVAINATLIIQAAPVAFDPFPASVEECTITYLKGNENPDAPIIENMTIYPNCTIQNGINDCNVEMMDIQRNRKWWSDAEFHFPDFPTFSPRHYVVRFQCGYVNAYGDSGSFKVEDDIWLG